MGLPFVGGGKGGVIKQLVLPNPVAPVPAAIDPVQQQVQKRARAAMGDTAGDLASGAAVDATRKKLLGE